MIQETVQHTIGNDSTTAVAKVDDSTTVPVNEAAPHWYKGIIKEETTSRSSDVQVIDKGATMEFILPGGTAQFAEMSVLDARGKLIWKTQSFNKNTIVWHKRTILGTAVPKGRYTFRMKQGNRQINGTTLVA